MPKNFISMVRHCVHEFSEIVAFGDISFMGKISFYSLFNLITSVITEVSRFLPKRIYFTITIGK